jgi:hypothetical protein
MKANYDRPAEKKCRCEERRLSPKAEMGGCMDVYDLSTSTKKQAKEL